MKYINYLKINEDITSGSAIVYHRTSEKEIIDLIKQNGFVKGELGRWGRGFYSCYYLKNQLHPNMRKYGNYLIECKIISLDKFLIIDYDIAKKVYGKNYRIKDQIRLLTGKNWSQFKDDQYIQNIDFFYDEEGDIEEFKKKYGKLIPDFDEKIISKGKNSSYLLGYLYENYISIIGEANGVVFSGRNDGNVLVAFNDSNVKPLRYSEDNGETWKSLLTKNIYNKNKDIKELETNIDNIINRYIGGRYLNMEDIKFINNNYESIEKNIDKFDYYKVAQILKLLYPTKKKKFLDFLVKYNKNIFYRKDNDLNLIFDDDFNKLYPMFNYGDSYKEITRDIKNGSIDLDYLSYIIGRKNLKIFDYIRKNKKDFFKFTWDQFIEELYDSEKDGREVTYTKKYPELDYPDIPSWRIGNGYNEYEYIKKLKNLQKLQ